MATTVPDRDNYNKTNYNKLLFNIFEEIIENFGERIRQDCPIFRTKSEKLEMAD
jgi:hypothetical protein